MSNLDLLMAEKAITLAIKSGDLPLLKYFVKKDIPLITVPVISPISVAANNGYLNIVKYLVEEGLSSDEITVESLMDGIYYAAGAGHCDVVDYLLQKVDISNNKELQDWLVECECDIH